MKFAEKLEWGTSLSTFKRIDEEVLSSIAASGIKKIELSFVYDYYFNIIDFPKNAAMYGDMASRCGVKLNSIHMPFSELLDISNTCNELRSVTVYAVKTLIRAAAEAGVRIAVLHPSSEPISDEKRAERFARSHDAIAVLNEECERNGLKLAVENLPRSCLCRTSDEMIRLLDGTGAGVVFDTNHALVEDNIHYIDAITAAGLKIHSLHISDYFRDENGVLDERHTLPGLGINNWNGILDALERHGYNGPLMYEVSAKPKNCPVEVNAAVLAENMKKLSHYEL